MTTKTKGEKSTSPGIPNKLLIKNDVVSEDMVMQAKPGMFSCIVGQWEYTTLVSITLCYSPIMTECSFGHITVTCDDTRYSGGNVRHSITFPTHKAIKVAAVNFGQSRTEDGCPIKVTITKELLGIEVDTIVGELTILPQFRCSSSIPIAGEPYIYDIMGRKKHASISYNPMDKRIGGVRITEEVIE